ncbi:hypothetical protein GS982_20380 [Rhodococcus hoagii]|nr:hypothetical protein [Prescottella equi]NKZ84552.1 hypothetical protein [Prescottella equi]
MSSTLTVGAAALTFVTGGGLVGLLKFWQDRRAAPAASAHAEVAAAKNVNGMALDTLTKCWEQLTEVQQRQGVMQKQLDDTCAELKETRTELAETRAEHSRIAGLFEQAIRALRDLVDTAIARGVPTPEMSPELRAEIGRPL